MFDAPDAAPRFREVLERGTLAGQLYAAIGLRHHDDASYEKAVAILRGRRSVPVMWHVGCSTKQTIVAELLESADPLAIRLAPGETFDDWFKTHKAGHPDIVGGSLTSIYGRVQSRRAK